LCLFRFGISRCGLICECAVVGPHPVDVRHLCKCRCPVDLPVVPPVVKDEATLSLLPGEVHVSAGEGGLCPGGDHCCFRDGHLSVLYERLTFFLFMGVNRKWEHGVNLCHRILHVVVNDWLQDCCLEPVDVGHQIAEGNGVQSFGWVVKCRVVNVVDGHGKLVTCDGAHDEVSLPCFFSARWLCGQLCGLGWPREDC
jgi:hypothetical protein